MDCKQVIVFRKDLLKGDHAIRKGKMASQCCHASLGALLKFFNKQSCYEQNEHFTRLECEFGDDSILDNWLNGIFTKIVVGTENEKSIQELYQQCLDNDIPCCLITDSGQTEFHGVPTVTCLGIGPYISEEIDKITGSLSLL